jgi:hypothetical protein
MEADDESLNPSRARGSYIELGGNRVAEPRGLLAHRLALAPGGADQCVCDATPWGTGEPRLVGCDLDLLEPCSSSSDPLNSRTRPSCELDPL